MERPKPNWLQGLMEETFFANCGAHETRRKNEKNIFCLQCCLSFCPHCLPSHLSHPLLQVRRYVYHDVVRQADLEKLIDCSYIQPYTINSAKVIFLNERPQTKPYKVAANTCFSCDRILQEPFNFCSLSCKVNHYEVQAIDLSNILFAFTETDLSFSEFKSLRMDGTDLIEDDGLMTSNSILEDHKVLRFEHGSSFSDEVSMSDKGMEQMTEVIKKKKKKNEVFLAPTGVSLGNKRKGAPQRSPLA
ncbi:unnamed protein product [Rhodiola kirilowii]